MVLDISKILPQEFLNHGEISHCSTHRLFHPDFAAPFDTGLDEACLFSHPNFRSYILVENMMSTYEYNISTYIHAHILYILLLIRAQRLVLRNHL